MNNFIFENATKTYFGKGCVKEYLTCLTRHCGKNVMLAYGGDAIRENGIYDEVMECLSKTDKNVIEFGDVMETPTYEKVLEGAKAAREYPKCNPEFALMDPAYSCHIPERRLVSEGFAVLSHIMEIYFSKPDEDNVSDDIAEALMKNVIQSLRTVAADPQDYTARSNLMWDAAMAESRILKLGKRTDFQCHLMERQLAVYTDCNQGECLAVLHPVYYRHIYRCGCHKFKRFAVNVWGIPDAGKTEEETAREGVEALASFIGEMGLPVALRDIGADENTDLRRIADSCMLSAGSYQQMTHDEIYKIFQECY